MGNDRFDPNLYHEKYRIPSARAEWWEYYEGIYFITIVTKNRRHYFGQIIRNSETGQNEMQLSILGKFVDDEIPKMMDHYPYVYIPTWIVMPNHIHFIIMIDVRGRDKNAKYGDDIDDNRAEYGANGIDMIKNNRGRDARAVRLYHERDKSNIRERAVIGADGIDKRDNSNINGRAVIGANGIDERDKSNIRERAVIGADGIDERDKSNIRERAVIGADGIDERPQTDRRTPELMSAIAAKSGSLPVVMNLFKRAITIFANKNNIPFAWQPRYYDVILKDQIGFDRVRRYIENNVMKWKTDKFKS